MANVKEVEMKLLELKQVSGVLLKILTFDLPVKQAYRLSKLAKSVDAELTEVEKHRIDLVKKYGAKNADGNYEVTDKIEDFNTEFNTILEEPVKLSFIPIDTEQLDDVKLSAINIVQIEKFIEAKDDSA
jgi:hypothetical protein